MPASDRFNERKRKKKYKSKTGLKRPAVGLTIPYKGWSPSSYTKRRRLINAETCGYSDREIDIIIHAPLKFSPGRWRKVRNHRYNQVVAYCETTGHSIPSKSDWKVYFEGLYYSRKDKTWKTDADHYADKIVTATKGLSGGREREELRQRLEESFYQVERKVISWQKAAQRLAEQYGHLTIFDIFYEDLQEYMLE